MLFPHCPVNVIVLVESMFIIYLTIAVLITAYVWFDDEYLLDLQSYLLLIFKKLAFVCWTVIWFSIAPLSKRTVYFLFKMSLYLFIALCAHISTHTYVHSARVEVIGQFAVSVLSFQLRRSLGLTQVIIFTESYVAGRSSL